MKNYVKKVTLKFVKRPTLIAQTAMQDSTPTVVIGGDTDLLILLIYHIKRQYLTNQKLKVVNYGHKLNQKTNGELD